MNVLRAQPHAGALAGVEERAGAIAGRGRRQPRARAPVVRQVVLKQQAEHVEKA